MNEYTKVVFFYIFWRRRRRKKEFFFLKWGETNYVELIINRYLILAHVSKTSNNHFEIKS